MKYIKTMALIFMLLGSSLSANEPNEHRTYQPLRHKLCKQTSHFYKSNYGVKRSWHDYRIFMYSSIRVARMFPMYPALNEKDRMLQLFELGQLETGHRKNFAVANIPKAKYSNGRVMRFSVDYGWAGLNDINVEWTYQVAKAIQDGRSLPMSYSTPMLRKALKGATIPKTLKLNKISLQKAARTKAEYERLVATGMNPEQIRKTLKVLGYTEYTQDQIDSALIYRVIVEIDRESRGWKYGVENYKSNRQLYKHLSAFVK